MSEERLVVCAQCRHAGERSRVQWVPLPRTLMATQHFYDEDGRAHYHDPNRDVGLYRCSKGHEFVIPEARCWCEPPPEFDQMPWEDYREFARRANFA